MSTAFGSEIARLMPAMTTAQRVYALRAASYSNMRQIADEMERKALADCELPADLGFNLPAFRMSYGQRLGTLCRAWAIREQYSLTAFYAGIAPASAIPAEDHAQSLATYERLLRTPDAQPMAA